jgi:hypothetical protein
MTDSRLFRVGAALALFVESARRGPSGDRPGFPREQGRPARRLSVLRAELDAPLDTASVRSWWARRPERRFARSV